MGIHELSEMFLAKQAFKKISACCGHSIQCYHADNGCYTNKRFLVSINSNDHIITSCGIGDHHQNMLVEWWIQVVTKTARTLLLHAQRHWPECVDTMLRPFAVKAVLDWLRIC